MVKTVGIKIWLWLFVLMPGGACAQWPEYHLQVFDYTYGIRPGTILGIEKDQDGFLWILYPRSVQRFDGKNIKEFKPRGNLEHIYCDSTGRLWISSPRATYLYSRETAEFVNVPVEYRDTFSAHGPVFQLPGKRALLSTFNGFYAYDEVRRVFVPALQELPVSPPYSVRAFAAYGHALFLGHEGMLYRYNTLTGDLDSLVSMDTRRIFPVSQDSALTNAWNLHSYWYDFASGNIRLAQLPKTMQDRHSSTLSIRSIEKMDADQYLIAAREGIFSYSRKDDSYIRLNLFHEGLPIVVRDYTNNLLYDGEGYVWMAAVDGIARFSVLQQSFGLLRVTGLRQDVPAGIDNIRAITTDGNGHLWLGTGNGLVRWEKGVARPSVFLPVEGSTTQMAYPSIRGLAFDGTHLILGPADLGIWILHPETMKYSRPVYQDDRVKQISEGDFIDAVNPTAGGDFLLTGRDALYKLEGGSYTLSIIQNPATNENTNFVFQGVDGEIWLTTNRGLHLLNPDLSYRMRVDMPTEDQFIFSGVLLPDQRLLYSLESGLYTARYVEGRVSIEKYTDVFDGTVLTILYFDENGILWATSEKGIFRFDPKQNTLNVFDYSDNVQGYGFNVNCYFRREDGTLFLGGANGLNYFIPESFSIQPGHLNVWIEEVSIGNHHERYVTLRQEADIPFRDRSVEVAFLSPYFNNPEKVKFRYRLEGLDEEWKSIEHVHRLRFTSLPPGKYSLRIEASVNQVDWVQSPDTFSFRIRSPFWLTWWFFTLVTLLLGGAVWWLIRSRNRRIAEQQEELEAEQAINYFSTRMMEDLSVDDVLWDVARNCIGRLEFEDCVIYLVDEEKNILVQKAAYGPKSPARHQILNPLEIPVGSGITGTVAATGKAEVIHDTTKDPRYIPDDRNRQAEIAVPIISDNRVLGVIDCEHSKKAFFTQRHLSILQTIASLCAAKIIKSRAEAGKRETERILMATKQQMADIEMQALRAQMNPHFIFNCLNSINRYIVKSDQATASLYLTRFAKLIRLILDHSNSKTVTLTHELDALRLYIEMESIRFEKQFTWEIRVDADVHPDHVYVPPLIIQPYVENAIWHGLLHKEEAGHLKIHILRRHASVLECVVEDNGVGREVARELKSKSASPSKSLGMRLTESRLALLNAHGHWDASVEIEDLRAGDGMPAGTRVILKIPVDA